MKKRATSLLLTLFLLLALGTNTAFATPSCQTTFSKTNFAPTTTGATYYDLDKISFSEGIYTDIKCPLDYVENANPGRGEYTVSGNKLSIGCVKNGNLLSINIPNLKPGKVYSISITGNVRLRAKENNASEKHRTKFKLAVGKSDNKYFENNKGDWHATGPCNMSLDFTASSDHAAATISTDYSGDCYILDISEIKIIGCFDPTITSSNGNDICKGEETTFTAVGISGGNSIVWKDGTKQIGTGQSIIYTPTEDKGTITAGSLSFPYTTKLCCSITAETETAFSQNFNTSINNPTLPQINPGAYSSSSYSHFSGSGNLGKNEYAIVHSTLEAGEWWDEPESYAYVPDDKTLTSTDKFLFINCDKVREEMFIYRISQEFCPNTHYEFTARIANVCNEEKTPANVKLAVYGYNSFSELNNSSNNGNFIKSYESGNLGANSGWQLARLNFNSGTYKYFRISISNNVADADIVWDSKSSEVVGNDLGIDDIEFKVCKPRVMVYTDNALTKHSLEVCDNADQTISLYAGNALDNYSSYMNDTWFVLQEAKKGSNLSDDKSWTNVKDKDGNTINAKKFTAVGEFTEVLVKEGQGETYYRAIVASSEATANDVAKNGTAGGCSIYGKTIKSDDYTTLLISCKNKSIAPTLQDYKECPSSDGKLDLYTRITAITLVDGTKNGTKIDLSNKTVAEKKTEIAKHGEIKWYKGNATTPLTDAETIVDLPSSADVADIYNATFTQKPSAITTYEASSKASVKVEIKKTIEVTVSPEEIEGCLSEISKDPAGRTFYVTKVNPVASPATDYTYTWKNVKTNGTEDATPLKSGDENFYALPSEAGSGTIRLYVESKTTAACPSVAKELTYNIADNPNFDCSISVPCNSQLSTTGIIINLTNISGSTALTIKRDGTEIKSETLTAGSTSYTYTDTNVAATATSVEYEVILGAGSCYKDFKETYNISAVNQFSITSNATDIKESDKEIEYHICEGTESTKNTVTVTAGYDLKPGELFEWYVNDVKDETADGNNKNYTLTELTEDTKFKAVIVAEAGAVTCGGEAEITIYVDKKPIVTVENKTICLGESTSFTASNVNYDSYQWTPTDFLSDPDKATTSVNKPTGSKTYSLKVVDGVCPTVVENIKLTVNPLPTINSVDVQTKDNGERNITIIADGEDPLTYSLDNVNFDGPEEIINKVSIGWNLLYLKDGNGCKDTLAFKIDPIEIIPDKYFTPNGDNNHEKWTVKNLNTYDSYIVEIFDRYGKRLFVQRVGSFSSTGKSDVTGDEFEGWDGIYNGHPMPSDDYWYLITVEEIRKQYTGHFTLKR
ncbi:MAG: T9SS type B sorting domain-containing protein [Paludibacteraceae bacterium]|nr:T9SS type B sorting domain-containing protein [Paludibacteraceae bacterium]